MAWSDAARAAAREKRKQRRKSQYLDNPLHLIKKNAEAGNQKIAQQWKSVLRARKKALKGKSKEKITDHDRTEHQARTQQTIQDFRNGNRFR